MNVPFRCKRVTLSSLLFIYLFITRTDVDDKAKKPGQVKKHRSQVTVLPAQKQPKQFTNANIRLKVSFNECFKGFFLCC